MNVRDYPFALYAFLMCVNIFRVLFAWYLPVPTTRLVRVLRSSLPSDYKENQAASDIAFLSFFWVPAVVGTIVRLLSNAQAGLLSQFWLSALALGCLIFAAAKGSRAAKVMEDHSLALPQVARGTAQTFGGGLLMFVAAVAAILNANASISDAHDAKGGAIVTVFVSVLCFYFGAKLRAGKERPEEPGGGTEPTQRGDCCNGVERDQPRSSEEREQ